MSPIPLSDAWLLCVLLKKNPLDKSKWQPNPCLKSSVLKICACPFLKNCSHVLISKKNPKFFLCVFFAKKIPLRCFLCQEKNIFQLFILVPLLFIWQPIISMEYSVSFFNSRGYMESAYIWLT